MFELAQELAYYASFVDNGATSGIVGLGQKLWAVSNIANAAQASLSAIVAPLNQIGTMWSEREQQINNVSRTLRQYEYVGQSVSAINAEIARSMPGADAAQRATAFTGVYNRQFQEARNLSRGVMQEMNQMAAILPGETNDYMQAFSQSLPFLSQARGMTLQRAVRLSSYTAAGGIAGGVDAGQTARDMMQFLTNGPHMVDRSWTEVWSQVATFRGKKVTAGQIRAMTLDKKVEVMENIANALRPQMDAMGDSYEATMGTFRSLKHEISLAGSEPLFEAWKRTMSAVNIQLATFAPRIGAVLSIISTKFAGGLDWVTTKIQGLGAASARAENWLVRHASRIGNMANTAAGFGHAAVHGIGGGMASMGGYVQRLMGAHQIGGTEVIRNVLPSMILRMLGMSFGPVGFIITSLITRMFMGGQAGGTIVALMTAVYAVIGPLFRLGLTLYRAYDAVMNTLVVLLGAVLPPTITVLALVLGLLTEGLSELVFIGVNLLMGALSILALTFGATAILAVTGIDFFVQAFLGIVRLLGGVFGNVAGESFDVIDAFRQIGDFLHELTRTLGEDSNYLLHELGLRSDEEYAAHQLSLANSTRSAGHWLDEFRASLQQAQTDLNRHGRRDRPTVPHTHNDFRFSRFDITQKFAEGFDPDRVATAFVTDLQAMAETQLSSGFQPGFSST